MIKLRFIPLNDESKQMLITIGKKQYLDLRLKPTKSWKKVLEHLCEKWSDISELSKRLTLHPYVDENSRVSRSTTEKNLLENLDSSVWSTLTSIQEYKLSNESDDGKIIPVGYLIRDLPPVELIRKPILCEDSLMRAINDWNDQSIDHYLKKEKDQQENKERDGALQSLHLGSSSSAAQSMPPPPSSSLSLIESTYTNIGNLDNIIHSSNTMNGLIQELLEPTNLVVPSSSSANPTKEPINPSIPNKTIINELEPTSKKKSKKNTLKSSVQKSQKESIPDNSRPETTEKKLAALPTELPNRELNALITAIEMEENATSFTKLVPSSTNLMDSQLLPLPDHSLAMKATTNPPLLMELMNDYSKSNTSHSNRNFAHIFTELSNKDHNKSHQSNHPDEKAAQLLNALATSNSLYQSIINQGQLPLESSAKSSSVLPQSHSSSSSKAGEEKQLTPQPSRKNNSSAMSANFAVNSPSTVVTPISDAEVSNVNPPHSGAVIATANPSTPIKQFKGSTTPSQPQIASSVPDLSYTSPQNYSVGGNSGIHAASKTPLSTKKRKFNGLQQKRAELLNSTLESSVLPALTQDRPSNLFSPMKISKTTHTPAPTPSKSLLFKDLSNKTQVALEQHVLTANIMSGVCHFPTGTIPPTRQQPSFIQQLSRKGRSRPELRRITPTYIGPLSCPTNQNIATK